MFSHCVCETEPADGTHTDHEVLLYHASLKPNTVCLDSDKMIFVVSAFVETRLLVSLDWVLYKLLAQDSSSTLSQYGVTAAGHHAGPAEVSPNPAPCGLSGDPPTTLLICFDEYTASVNTMHGFIQFSSKSV